MAKAAAKTGMTKRQKRRILNGLGYAFTAVIAIAMLYSVVVKRTPRATPQRTRQIEQQAAQPGGASAPAACPARTGEPWEFDAATTCYFDPSPGHGHWHPGRPPDPSERAARMAPPAPQPIQLQPMTAPPGPATPP